MIRVPFISLLLFCLPAVTLASAGSIYLVPGGQSIDLTDDAARAPGSEILSPSPVPAKTVPPGRRAFPTNDVRDAVVAASTRHGVSIALIHAVIDTESAYRPQAVSSRGAMGLMQLMPATARSYGVADAFDIRANIDAGARHLRRLIDRFGSDTSLVLAAYNAGEEAVVRHGHRIPPYPETLSYVPRVLQRLARLTHGDLAKSIAMSNAPELMAEMAVQ